MLAKEMHRRSLLGGSPRTKQQAPPCWALKSIQRKQRVPLSLAVQLQGNSSAPAHLGLETLLSRTSSPLSAGKQLPEATLSSGEDKQTLPHTTHMSTCCWHQALRRCQTAVLPPRLIWWHQAVSSACTRWAHPSTWKTDKLLLKPAGGFSSRTRGWPGGYKSRDHILGQARGLLTPKRICHIF